MTAEIFQSIINKLSEPQADVVTSESRYLRIVAGAGTGKTETMTRRILFLLANGVDPSSIVAFTFTEKAAEEMKERVYIKTEQIFGNEASTRLGDIYIGTIHSFAMQLLQDHFGYGNYDVLDEHKEMAFLLREGWSLGLGRDSSLGLRGKYSKQCQIFIKSVNVVYNDYLDYDQLESRSPVFASKLSEYENKLDMYRLLTFGRMIYLAVKHLEERPEVLTSYKHLIVDEFQDINLSQERLIDLICRYASCYVVGDPRQCIYQWRGSDPKCFGRFAERYNAQTKKIIENRRSTHPIVNLGNTTARQFSEESLREPIKHIREEPGKVEQVIHETPEDEADWIADQIRALIDLNICNYQDIAILLRSVSTSGPVILDALRAKEIPFLVGGKVGLFRRDEAQALGAIFCWLADMDWPLDQYWQNVVPCDQIVQFAADILPGTFSISDLESFKEKILSGEFKNFTDAYQALLILVGVMLWDPEDPEDAACLANLGRFNTLINDYEAARRLGGKWGRRKSDISGLAWFLVSYAQSAYEEQAPDDLRGIDAVQVMTVHQAKGLEWPVVFLPAMVERRFPSSRTGQSQEWLVPKELFDFKRYEGNLDDERKLFYVAVTRARDNLCLSCFQRINTSFSPSIFLRELGLTSSRPSLPFITEIHRTISGTIEEIVTFSAGEVIDYMRCPHFYRLRHLWEYQAGLAKELGYGTSIHHILQMAAEKAKCGEDIRGEIDGLIDQYFHLPYAPGRLLDTLREAARKILKGYVNDHYKDFMTVEEVEARLEFRLSEMFNKIVTINGRVDVILSPEGQRELRDYKTAHEPGAGDISDPKFVQESEMQMSLYAMGEQKLGRPVQKASVVFLRDGSLWPVSLEESVLKEKEQQALSAISSLLNKKFTGRTCESCKKCDYGTICHYYKQ